MRLAFWDAFKPPLVDPFSDLGHVSAGMRVVKVPYECVRSGLVYGCDGREIQMTLNDLANVVQTMI